MKRWTPTVVVAVLFLLVGLPTAGFAQVETAGADATEQTDTGESDDSKSWEISGSLTSRVGQGTFVDLENNTGVEGEIKPNSTAYDRVNLIYRLSPSYTVGEFQFGAEVSMVQWLTVAAGTSTTANSGGANDPAAVYFQDTTLSGSWKGYTFDSIGLNLAPSLEIGLPTSKTSQHNTKLFHANTSLALSKSFFDRLTFQGVLSFSKYFHRYKTAAVDPEVVGRDNVLFRPGEAEDLSSGLVALGGYNISHLLSFGGVAQVKIIDDLSGSISYFFVNYYSYQSNNADQYTAERAQPNEPLSQQAVSTSVRLSYGVTDWLSVSGGIGSFMAPKTSDNKSFRFPFWNTDGAAANRSWMQLGVSGKY